MSELPASGGIPEWDLADRLRKALRAAGLGVTQMAAYLGVSRNTVSTWINGRINPSKQTLRLWAIRTGVPYEWLCHGDSAPRHPDPSSGVPAAQPGGEIFTYHRRALAPSMAA